MQTFYTFKTPKTFQTFLRKKEWKSGELDYITIGKRVYTMHEYDNDGKQITWANKKHNDMIELNTSNRYKNGYGDSKILKYHTTWLRNDINFYE